MLGRSGGYVLTIKRPVQDVASGTFVGDLFVDVAEALLHLIRRQARALKAGGAVGEERVEHDECR
jgi:hypothetical protein